MHFVYLAFYTFIGTATKASRHLQQAAGPARIQCAHDYLYSHIYDIYVTFYYSDMFLVCPTCTWHGHICHIYVTHM